MISKEKYVLDRIIRLVDNSKSRDETIRSQSLKNLIEQWLFDYDMEKEYRPEVLMETKAEMYKAGEKYKSYLLWDFEKTGKYDVFEVIAHDGELAFFNHTDKTVYDLEFLGHSELVKFT